MDRITLDNAKVTDLTDSSGAVTILSERFGRTVKLESLWQWTRSGRIRAFIFHQGKLVERSASMRSQGKDLFFLIPDLLTVDPPAPVGRPARIQNKA